MEKRNAVALTDQVLALLAVEDAQAESRLRPMLSEGFKMMGAPAHVLMLRVPELKVYVLAEDGGLFVEEVRPQPPSLSIQRFLVTDALVEKSAHDAERTPTGDQWATTWRFHFGGHTEKIDGHVGPGGADDAETFAPGE